MTKSLGEIIAEHNKGIDCQDNWGNKVNQIEGQVS